MRQDLNLDWFKLTSWSKDMASRRHAVFGITVGIIFGGGFGMTVMDNIALGGLTG